MTSIYVAHLISIAFNVGSLDKTPPTCNAATLRERIIRMTILVKLYVSISVPTGFTFDNNWVHFNQLKGMPNLFYRLRETTSKKVQGTNPPLTH